MPPSEKGFLARLSKAFSRATCPSANSYCVTTSMQQSAFPSWQRTPRFTSRLFTRCLAQTEIQLPAICLKSSPICKTRRECVSRSEPREPPCALNGRYHLREQNALLLSSRATDRTIGSDSRRRLQHGSLLPRPPHPDGF